MKQIIKGTAAAALLAVSGFSSAQTVEYIHTDALGTPVAVSDAAGAVIERSEYEPYGAVLNRPVKDGPGFTGHVEDGATGLTYMQQRYYDPAVGVFLSVDPIGANPNALAQFNRYRYGNSNPYKLVDPDGRRACGRDTTCQTIQNKGGISVGRGEIAAAKRNPEAFLQRINERGNHSRTLAGASRFFARAAMPVTLGTGREVGADIASLLSGGYSAVNFRLGDPSSGDGSGGVGFEAYSGPGERAAIIHTHPINSPLSGIAGRYHAGRWSSEMNGTNESDAYNARRFGVPNIVATPNGDVSMFNYPKMNADIKANGSGTFYASDYVKALP